MKPFNKKLFLKTDFNHSKFKNMTRNYISCAYNYISYDCNFKTTTCNYKTTFNCISYDYNYKTTTYNFISYERNFKTTTCDCISYDFNYNTSTCNYISYECNYNTMTYDLNKLTTADKSQPTLQAHLHFSNAKAVAKNAKEPAIFPCCQHVKTVQNISGTDLPAPNSTLAIGGVSSPLDSFVVAESSVLRTNFCAEKPAHRQSANR
jgi:hypothetical protein